MQYAITPVLPDVKVPDADRAVIAAEKLTEYLDIEGRPDHEQKNVFDYKAAETHARSKVPSARSSIPTTIHRDYPSPISRAAGLAQGKP